MGVRTLNSVSSDDSIASQWGKLRSSLLMEWGVLPEWRGQSKRLLCWLGGVKIWEAGALVKHQPGNGVAVQNKGDLEDVGGVPSGVLGGLKCGRG